MYAFRTSLGPVDLAFTDRFGGVSGVPYDELNLGINTSDDPLAVARNLAAVLQDFAPGARPAPTMRQVHGADVVVIAGPLDDATWSESSPEADAMVTDQPDVVLVVRVADCVPVVLSDRRARVIGVAHAGRPGMAAGVISATVARMRELGAEHLTAHIGPHVCGGCYEVPEQMQRQVAALVPESASTTSWGTPSLDIGAGVRAQLVREGVDVVDVSQCTRESADLYSFRRDGADAGRFAGLIRMRA